MKNLMLAGFALAGLAACGTGTPQMAADSARIVELAAADSGYRLNDRPAPSPAPSRIRSLTLASGTRIDASTQRTISSRTDKAGATFTATVSSDVKDSRGRVVIPASSTLNLTITELQPANDKSKADGKITVLVSSVSVRGQTYPVSASITSMAHTLKGQGVGGSEVGKTAAGAVIGGVAGRVIGGGGKGTVIGAVVGAAAGAAVAVETANRDVVVAVGTPIVVTLSERVVLAPR